MKKSFLSFSIFSCAFFIFIICTSVSTCTGDVDSDPTPCRTDNQGEIVFVNNTSLKRDFLLNGVNIESVNASSKSAIHLKPVGDYTVKVINTLNSKDTLCASKITVEMCRRTTYSCPH